MKISVIIPTCNRVESLLKCLDCLHPDAQGQFTKKYEVIVSDDSTTDELREIVENLHPWVRWVQGPRRGPAANRNNGVKYAVGEWIAFTDDDCLPCSDWLYQYAKHFDLSGIEVLEGKTIADREKKRYDEVAPINLTGGNLWSCNFMVTKKLFWAIGGFDENFPFPAMEDVDFHIRVKKKSNVEFVREAVVVHPWRINKPFSTYKKSLNSHKYITLKYNQSNFNHKIKRIKILISHLIKNGKTLKEFSFRGYKYYLEEVWLNIMLIFV